LEFSAQQDLAAHGVQVRSDTTLTLAAWAEDPEADLRAYSAVFWALRVRGGREEWTRPLARVLRWPEWCAAPDPAVERVEAVAEVLARHGHGGSRDGHILEPFAETPLLGLERRMSSGSVLYVFAGLVAYADAVRWRMRHVGGANAVRVAGRTVAFPCISELWPLVRGVFEGPGDRVAGDRRLAGLPESVEDGS
jgi:hypothetical protein